MTIGFSSKLNSWTSKYSYQPMHMACNSANMITFNFDGNINSNSRNSICWVHDSTAQSRNIFYKSFTPSYFTVSFNEDSSSEKVFNAVSIESNQNDFSASITTNLDDFAITNITEAQISYIPVFSAREESLYSSCGRSIINSTQNINVFGFVSGYSYEEIIQGGTSYVDLRIDFTPLSTNLPSNGKLFLQAANNLYYVAQEDSNSPTPILPLSELDYNAFDGQDLQLVPGKNQIRVTANFAVFVIMQQFLNLLIAQGTLLGTVLDPSVDGDEMRGRYMMATFFSGTSARFEISAVNADYSLSQLNS